MYTEESQISSHFLFSLETDPVSLSIPVPLLETVQMHLLFSVGNDTLRVGSQKIDLLKRLPAAQLDPAHTSGIFLLNRDFIHGKTQKYSAVRLKHYFGSLVCRLNAYQAVSLLKLCGSNHSVVCLKFFPRNTL